MTDGKLGEDWEKLVHDWQIWDHEHRYTNGKGLIETKKVEEWLMDRVDLNEADDRKLLADWLMEAAEALGEILTEIRQHPQLFGPDAQRASEVAQALAAVAASWQMVVG